MKSLIQSRGYEGNQHDPERYALVNEARARWSRRLVDMSRRNNLLFYRELKTGTLDISEADPKHIAALLNGQSTSLIDLLPSLDEVKVSSQVREIRRRALTNLEEKGLQTLFLAVGMATWTPVDEGRPPESPVLLIPFSIESKGRENRNLKLVKTGDIQINPVLIYALSQYGSEVKAEELLELLPENGKKELDLLPIFEQLDGNAKDIKGFKIIYRVVLANFSFQKMAMVNDLQEWAEELCNHDLISAIAGDTSAREAIRATINNINPNEFDSIPPQNEMLVLDADSSQQLVISAVISGQNGVIQGPPGTGKSQTIVNLISALTTNRKPTLFVAEKRAALEVVMRRLEEVGLKHIVLDLHGADLSRRLIIEQIKNNLSLVHNTGPVNIDDSFYQKLTDRRKQINQYVKQLHMPRNPSNMSAFEMMGRLLRFPKETHSSTRWRGADLECLDRKNFEIIKDRLFELGGFEGLYLQTDTSPWTSGKLISGNDVQQAGDIVRKINNQSWPFFTSYLQALISETKVVFLKNFKEVKIFLELLRRVKVTLTLYSDEIYKQNLEEIVSQLKPADNGVVSSILAWLFNASYRKSLKLVRNLRREDSASAIQLFKEATQAFEQLNIWRSLPIPSSVPYKVMNIDRDYTEYEALLRDIELIRKYLPGTDTEQMSLDQLEQWIKTLNSDQVTPHRIPRMLEIERDIDNKGAKVILEEIRKLNLKSEYWPILFEHAWVISCLEKTFGEEPSLAAFYGRTHEEFIRDFSTLDREKLKLSAHRLRRIHAQHVIDTMNEYPEQAAIVQREAQKKARHLPLRKLLAKAPNILTALFPCWMASPLSVSQLMDARQRYFEMVIFDEASQVLPEDAIPSLLRAKQAIVAGDSHQLPPTMFFASGEEDDEDISYLATEGFESLLDLLSSFLPSWMLEWHYRSRDEKLIAFSNHYIYQDRLITFPGPRGQSSVSHILVPFTPGQDGQEESSSEEVRRVVELVLEHAEKHPGETLGVITMGIKHARRIEAALDEALKHRSDLDEFFDTKRLERFFVKNLERVQGDERDVIIVSIGYGKDHSGKLPYRFGPLLMDGGERRLNVALTRARQRMLIVSSFDHHDMDPSRSKSKGVQLLRSCFEYAISNGKLLGDYEHSNVPLNAFEADVFDTLSSRGIPLIPQWGVSQ
ncbi:MAG: DUF4011 domain-containing protein, partial [Deltaproteobacteria bacterium]|nr:DUF4011 domain-containing protein [Deltaproteobacteria bacterium]